MIKELSEKLVRYGITATIFIAMIIIQGVAPRETNQMVMMLMLIAIWSLFLKNIWATLFVSWTVFLFWYFKFSCGDRYLSNMLLYSMLYLFTKNCFKKEHINGYIEAFLWFVCINIFYSALQLIGFDFIYKHKAWDGFIFIKSSPKIAGFMGHQSILSTLIAFSIPILATRGSRVAWLGVALLFIPLYLCKTALCLIAGIVGVIYVLFFRIKRIYWIGCVVFLALFSLFYVSKVDGLGTERLTQWHDSMRDYMKHPITGWGLDSYANITPNKDFLYPQTKYEREEYDFEGKTYKKVIAVMWWDNPHNLIISILYEFGFVGLVFVFMYYRQIILKFSRSILSPNTIGLFGVILTFSLISLGHFPIFLARLAPIIVCSFALFEVSV